MAILPVNAIFELLIVIVLVVVSDAESVRLAKNHCHVLVHITVCQGSLSPRLAVIDLAGPSRLFLHQDVMFDCVCIEKDELKSAANLPLLNTHSRVAVSMSLKIV